MSLRTTSRAVVSLALLASLLAISAPRQDESGRVSFPRLVPKDESSPYDRPVWIDASELFTSWGAFRRPEDAEVMPSPRGMLSRLDQARANGTYRNGESCYEDGITLGAQANHPPSPDNLTDLEVLAEAIILGRIVGVKPGFLKGRAVGLYEIEVLEVLKGADVVGNASSVFLFWPETRFDFDSFCIQWSIAGWFAPPPELGREILLTPVHGVLETIADRPAIVALGWADVIYEAEGGLRSTLRPTLFPEVYSAGSLREFDFVRRLRDGRQGR